MGYVGVVCYLGPARVPMACAAVREGFEERKCVLGGMVREAGCALDEPVPCCGWVF